MKILLKYDYVAQNHVYKLNVTTSISDFRRKINDSTVEIKSVNSLILISNNVDESSGYA